MSSMLSGLPAQPPRCAQLGQAAEAVSPQTSRVICCLVWKPLTVRVL